MHTPSETYEQKPHVCFIIPPQISEAVLDSDAVPQSIKDFHRATLNHTHGLRGQRFQASADNRLQGERPRTNSVVQPQVHSAIVSAGDTDEQEAAAFTLQHDTEARAARPRGMNRTIYDAEHTSNYGDLPGDVVLLKEGGPPIPVSNDATNDGNECYDGFADTYALFNDVFGRNSIDGQGAKLIGSVHYGVKYQNAFWDGKQMVFGDGDGQIFRDFTSRNDVIGHELTHAVIQHTANLEYNNQSGALNESLADAFGIMVKHYKLKQPAEKASWVIAEGIWGEGIKGRGLRDMKAPGTAYNDPKIGKDPQPSSMVSFKKLPNNEQGDFGGVHINSGIPNRAFYLVCTKIGGNSWESAGPIWYKTLTGGKLPKNATFKQFADLTYANAGAHGPKVAAAWKEVGITVNTKVKL